MTDLEFSIRQLMRHNRDGSFATQANRRQGLAAIAGQLHGLGYKLKTVNNLKPRHVEALVACWKRSALADETIRNRLGWLRWVADHCNKPGLLPKDNAAFGLRERTPYQGNRARILDAETLSRISDPTIRLALRLQAAFGLRREEALKFRPAIAFKGDRLVLRASWCKGGRGREIPIVHPRQLEILAEVRAQVGTGSLIPADKTFVAHLQTYKATTRAAGLGQAHGLRHAYAQWRYRRLTGWDCPAKGGPTAEIMTERDRAIDKRARQQISGELGHGRIDVTDTYLGRRWAGGRYRKAAA